MAKRRSKSSGDEVSLFPFLSILACLIGALIMIIVVLAVSQSQETGGRTPEEMKLAQDYQKMLEQQKEQQELTKDVDQKVEQLEKLKAELAQKSERVARLRKLLTTDASIKEMNQQISQELLKELDNLLLEIDGFKKQEVEIKKELELLMAELNKRQIPKDKPIPPVVVQPGGSGLAAGSKVFFVEVSGGRITVYWDAEKKTVLSAADEVVVADVAFNEYLKQVKAMPKSKIIFLLRDDGMNAFNKAAGWAMSTYQFSADQIGRLPLPGRGEVDLKMFNEFLGTIPPPEGVKLVEPKPPAAAPAPTASVTN
ncbi:hypothetical protein FEM03_15405 [Phragmitibacter flavus]|uniref:Uncharacterized protein n=1 Tax=Phragmitibacter flavus TaxID=2576071 RepID=A0A5R8KBM0_9BACT|nr:hypothetical protein [Phragmitibacter flavus]TLD69713.1 hypothetical protein FEM03_15405 [Phragmitibacter flavus]